MSTRTYQNYEQVKQITSSYDLIPIQIIGGYTFAKIHPNIVTEAMVSTQDCSSVMSATGTQYVQIFKASHDNIHQLKLFGAINYLATSTIDTMDYADDTALRAVWITNSSAKVLNYNDKLIVYEGSSSMRITAINAKADGYYIQRDYGSATDFSTATAANILLRFRKSDINIQVAMRAVDTSNNTASITLGVSNINEWTLQQYNRNQFIDDQATSINWTQIRYIRFVVISNTQSGQSAWIDNLRISTEATENNLQAQIYHCGSVLPTSASTITDWTLLTSDQNNTSLLYSIRTLKNMVGEYITISDTFGLNHIQPKLIVDDYYAIVLTWKADNIILRGLFSCATSPYSKGVLLKSADSGISYTSEQNSSLRFTLYSCVNCRIKSIELHFNDQPLHTKFFLAYNDGVEHCNSILTGGIYFDNMSHSEEVEFDYDTSKQIGVYIEHDKDSDLTFVNVETIIHYVPSALCE